MVGLQMRKAYLDAPRHKRVEPLNNRLDRQVRTAWRIEQGLYAPTEITPDDVIAIRRALSCYR